MQVESKLEHFLCRLGQAKILDIKKEVEKLDKCFAVLSEVESKLLEMCCFEKEKSIWDGVIEKRWRLLY